MEDFDDFGHFEGSWSLKMASCGGKSMLDMALARCLFQVPHPPGSAMYVTGHAALLVRGCRGPVGRCMVEHIHHCSRRKLWRIFA